MQTVALIAYLTQVRKNPGPYLIVAPASVLPHWISEFQAFCPDISVSAYRGSFEERTAVWNTKVVSQRADVAVHCCTISSLRDTLDWIETTQSLLRSSLGSASG